MAALTYTTLQTTLLVALSQAPSPYNVIPPDFAQLYPQAITYAEGRIYRDLVPVANRQQNSSLSTTASSRTLDLTAISPLVVEGFALITPSGTSNPKLGTRVQFDAASLDAIDLFWPNESVTVAPQNADWYNRSWAMRDDHTIVFCPTPDAVYTVELTGMFQPAALSSTNATTYLSTVYPELLTAACMIWLTGALLRNFGASADDPKMALSWEKTYAQDLLPKVLEEEQRRRSQGVGWSANPPSQAQPQRT